MDDIKELKKILNNIEEAKKDLNNLSESVNKKILEKEIQCNFTVAELKEIKFQTEWYCRYNRFYSQGSLHDKINKYINL
jgi:hypothetical protein